GQTGRTIGRLSQQKRQTVPCSAETQRRLQGRIQFRIKRTGERRCASGGFLESGAAWQMSQVRLSRVRARNELHLREFGRLGKEMRLSIGQSHLAASDRSRSNEETARNWQDRSARAVHFPKRPAVQSVSAIDRQERRMRRMRKARPGTRWKR